MRRSKFLRLAGRLLAALAVSASLGSAAAALGTCGPFTDVAADAFCPLVLEIFTLGITTGTTATTYDAASNVTRLQMAAFLSRTVDGVLKRGSRRAAMWQFWTTQATDSMQVTTLNMDRPEFIEFDGADLWVSGSAGNDVISRVRASDGKLLNSFTGDIAEGQLTRAMGRIFFIARVILARDRQADAARSVAAGPGSDDRRVEPPQVLLRSRFRRRWIRLPMLTAQVSIVTPDSTLPWTVTTTAGGYQETLGVLYDGTSVWITDLGSSPGALLKLNASGGVLQTVTVGQAPELPLFDGAKYPGCPTTGPPRSRWFAPRLEPFSRTLTGQRLERACRRREF